MAARIGLLGLGLLTLSWMVPNHYRPWDSFHSEAFAFVGMALLVVNCLLEHRGRGRTDMPAVGWVVLLLMALPWIQFAAGVIHYAGDAIIVSLYLVATAGAIWVGYISTGTPASNSTVTLGSMLGTIAIGAFASAVIGLLQWLTLEDCCVSLLFQASGNGRAIGNIAQANLLGSLLLMGLLIAGYAFDRGLMGKLGFGAIAGLMSLTLALTQSRAAILSAVVVGIFMLFKAKVFSSRLTSRLIVAWLVSFLVASWLLPTFADLLLISGTRGSLTYTHTSDRFHIWQQMAQAIFQAPWLGYGWNLSAVASIAGAYDYPSDLTYSFAHSIVLDLLVWNGVPLGLVLIAMCVTWIASRSLRVVSRDSVYAFAALLPLIVHSLLEYPFAYAYFLLPAGFLVGSIEANLGARRITLEVRHAWVAFVVWTIIGSCLAYEYFLIEEDFRIVRFEGMRVGKTPQEYEVPKVRLASHMGAMLRAARQPAEPGLTPKQMASLREAAMRFPYGALTYRYALALGLNGDPQGARRMMATIRGMYGEKYYHAVRDDMLSQASERYPQLKAVDPP